MQAGVKYKIVGGKKFLERKEVKDLLSYLRLLVNPRNIPALKRSINTPARGIGEKSQLAFFKWVERTDSEYQGKSHIQPTLLDYFYALRLLTERRGDLDDDQENNVCSEFDLSDDLDERLHVSLAHSCPLNTREKRVLSKYALLITRLHQASRKIQLTDLIDQLLTQVDYREYITQLSGNDPETISGRWGNVVEVIKTAERYSVGWNGVGDGGSALANLVEYFDCFQSSFEEENADETEDEIVQLMTIHASKGLEFDVVFISGVEEGVLPLTTKGISEEEEKRLAYVAITRAKSLLIITYRELLIQFRSNGSHYRFKSKPSRFLTPLKSLPSSTCSWVTGRSTSSDNSVISKK
jgi:DNA helicase II / ATP-dependent DNA helicase PcrA